MIDLANASDAMMTGSSEVPSNFASSSPRTLPWTQTTPPRDTAPRPASFPLPKASLAETDDDRSSSWTDSSKNRTGGALAHASLSPLTTARNTRANTRTESSSFSRVNVSRAIAPMLAPRRFPLIVASYNARIRSPGVSPTVASAVPWSDVSR